MSEEEFRMSDLEFACLQCRVPKSGNEVVDGLIKEALRRDFAESAMQGVLTRSGFATETDRNRAVREAVIFADLLLAELSKTEGKDE